MTSLNEKMLEARGTGRKDYSMKIKVCGICGKEIPDGEEHYIQFKGEVCGNCFVEELKKSKEQWIKNHPCPFKYEAPRTTYPENAGGRPVIDGTELRCDVRPPRLCIGEKNCPIYNGGMK